MDRRFVLAALALGGLACASPSPQPLIDAQVLEPGARERVVVDQVVVLVDASSSVPAGSLFRTEKNLARSFAASMPEGDYEVATIGFGGFERQTTPLARFERSRARSAAEELSHLAEGTPLHRAIAEAAEEIDGRSGHAAVLLYSDGVATDEIGRPVAGQRVLDAARELRAGYDGTVCFHTVQVGNAAGGGTLLRQLAGLTDCGTFRRAETLTTTASLHQFQREALLGAKPQPATPPVAAAPSDRDADGIYDADDLCPGTPRGASVDTRGCWVVEGVHFATDSAKLGATDRGSLDDVVRVLRENPELRVRIDGHTDSVGSRAYNETLSKQRARAVRDHLVAAGISADRLDMRGWGEANPATSNDTAEGRRVNRRTEISVLR